MTTQPATYCLWCATDTPRTLSAGRPRLYCSADCQQAAESERRTLRRMIARYETQAIEQVGMFVIGAKDVRPRLQAARDRLTAITPPEAR